LLWLLFYLIDSIIDFIQWHFVSYILYTFTWNNLISNIPSWKIVRNYRIYNITEAYIRIFYICFELKFQNLLLIKISWENVFGKEVCLYTIIIFSEYCYWYYIIIDLKIHNILNFLTTRSNLWKTLNFMHEKSFNL
jgi:hypothetical protein